MESRRLDLLFFRRFELEFATALAAPDVAGSITRSSFNDELFWVLQQSFFDFVWSISGVIVVTFSFFGGF